MTDWATIFSLATAGGTLVLAVATFSAMRSSNRSARIAEQALQEQRRPVLVHARLDDPVQKIMFGDGHWVRAEGSQAVIDEALHDPDDELHGGIVAARAERRPLTLDLLYSDQVGGQRTISRFGLMPAGEDRWLGSVTRHWNLDYSGPR